ncbi:putative DsbA family dithiol-disulfide isomerase [Luteimonas cucumeris]|uniref:Putative DsbA family dithiol-disulfide isomerase n=1 Tax=Luteimonas cucumeris TaxID=985012 RepID=A0A562LE74_9GAMM|nr:DsbA family oxidoreductase [Luteimonas cucumeris]TWI05982.1 putative DsbA family dithiol-disulfide isomerase [Luteimonas cucumeris]
MSTQSSSSPIPLRIDFVSDVSCPWCAIGLQSLQQAIERVGDEIAVDLHFAAFELNPQMPPEGQDAIEHLTVKYGISAEQAISNGEAIRQRGAQLGFVFDMGRRRKVYNTFDAHRLLYWAGQQSPSQQLALKQTLLRAYFSDGQDISSPEILVGLAAQAGLDGDRAREVLDSGRYAKEVRGQEELNTVRGINAVPAVIIDRHLLVQGGQPPAVFEQALRQAAGKRSAVSP